jgi:hypothetical protein
VTFRQHAERSLEASAVKPSRALGRSGQKQPKILCRLPSKVTSGARSRGPLAIMPRIERFGNRHYEVHAASDLPLLFRGVPSCTSDLTRPVQGGPAQPAGFLAPAIGQPYAASPSPGADVTAGLARRRRLRTVRQNITRQIST